MYGDVVLGGEGEELSDTGGVCIPGGGVIAVVGVRGVHPCVGGVEGDVKAGGVEEEEEVDGPDGLSVEGREEVGVGRGEGEVLEEGHGTGEATVPLTQLTDVGDCGNDS